MPKGVTQGQEEPRSKECSHDTATLQEDRKTEKVRAYKLDYSRTPTDAAGKTEDVGNVETRSDQSLDLHPVCDQIIYLM